jgi:hypothetical protein
MENEKTANIAKNFRFFPNSLKISFLINLTMFYPNLQKKKGFCDHFEIKKKKVEKSENQKSFQKISNKKSKE